MGTGGTGGFCTEEIDGHSHSHHHHNHDDYDDHGLNMDYHQGSGGKPVETHNQGLGLLIQKSPSTDASGIANIHHLLHHLHNYHQVSRRSKGDNNDGLFLSVVVRKFTVILKKGCNCWCI